MAEQYAPIAKDSSLNTTENTPRNLADVLADELQGIANAVKPTASDIPFDPTGTSLVSTDVEGAIKEVNDKIQFKSVTQTTSNVGQTTVDVLFSKFVSVAVEAMWVNYNAVARQSGTGYTSIFVFDNNFTPVVNTSVTLKICYMD